MNQNDHHFEHEEIQSNRKKYEQKITVKEKNISKQDEINERKKQSYALDVQGYSNKEIANKIGCSLSTIEKDLREARNNVRTWFAEIANYDRFQAFIDAVLHIDAVQKEAWKQYRDEEEPKEKRMILQLIVDTAVKKKDLFNNGENYFTPYFLNGMDLKKNAYPF